MIGILILMPVRAFPTRMSPRAYLPIYSSDVWVVLSVRLSSAGGELRRKTPANRVFRNGKRSDFPLRTNESYANRGSGLMYYLHIFGENYVAVIHFLLLTRSPNPNLYFTQYRHDLPCKCRYLSAPGKAFEDFRSCSAWLL